MKTSQGFKPSNLSPFVCSPMKFCWDCQIAKPKHEMEESKHLTGLTIWRCGCGREEPPFMTVVGGHVLIHEGGTGCPLPDSWQGLCVDGGNTKAFWLIGRDEGERSFSKLPAHVTTRNAAIEFAHARKTAQAQAALLGEKAAAIWRSLANAHAVVTGVLPSGFRADWITMNATRPLFGDLVCEDGPYLCGRWYACINPEVEFAAELVRQNLRNDCKVVLVASPELQEAMAIETISPEYKVAYKVMAPDDRREALTPFVASLNKGKTHVELTHLMAEATRRMTLDALVEMARRNNPT